MEFILHKYAAKVRDLFGFPVRFEHVSVKDPSHGEIHQFSCYSTNDPITYIAYFKLVDMPGCCGVVVSTGSLIHPAYRCKGLGTLLNTMRIELANELGFGAIICTDKLVNLPQRRILDKNGWFEAAQFNNPNTGNDVSIHTYVLHPSRASQGKQRTSRFINVF